MINAYFKSIYPNVYNVDFTIRKAAYLIVKNTTTIYPTELDKENANPVKRNNQSIKIVML